MPEVGLKPWEPNKLSARHKHVIALSAGGLKNKEIAEIVDMSESRVSVILKDPRAEALRASLCREYIRQNSKEVADLIQSHTRDAVEKLVQLMKYADQEGVQLRAAENFLDRGGFPKVKEQVKKDATVPLDNEKADLLIQAIREAQGEMEEIEMIEDTSGIFRAKDEFDE